MTTSDVIELVSEMKRMGVLYFKYDGLEVAFKDNDVKPLSQPLFSDQVSMIDELRRVGEQEVDPDGKPVVTGYSDDDLFGSA